MRNFFLQLACIKVMHSMQTVIAVVAEQSESINVHNWFLALEQRINAFQNVHIVMDIEYAPSIQFLKRLQDPQFANSIGAQQMLQSTNPLVCEYDPPLYVCAQPTQFGTLGQLPNADINVYNTSHDKLCRRHYTEEDAKDALVYNMITQPVGASVKCATFRVLHYLGDGRPKTEDFLFPFYLYENAEDGENGMQNMKKNNCAPLKYMAHIWHLLLQKANRVYAWGTIDITLPLDWFVLHDVFEFTLTKAHTLLRKLGWQVEKENDYIKPKFEGHKQTSKSVFHNLQTSLCGHGKKMKKLQASVDFWMPVSRDGKKLLDFSDLDLMFAMSNRATLEEKIPTETKSSQMIFSTFDRLCESVFRCSLLQYNHRDVVLVCKLLSHCCRQLDTHPALSKIYIPEMEAMNTADVDASVQVTLVCFVEPATTTTMCKTCTYYV
jgi:hypothetical protein